MYPTVLSEFVRPPSRFVCRNKNSATLRDHFDDFLKHFGSNLTHISDFCIADHVPQRIPPNRVTSLTIPIGCCSRSAIFAVKFKCGECIQHVLNQPVWSHVTTLTIVGRFDPAHQCDIFHRIEHEKFLERFPALKVVVCKLDAAVWRADEIQSIKLFVSRFWTATSHFRKNITLDLDIPPSAIGLGQFLVLAFPLVNFKSLIRLWAKGCGGSMDKTTFNGQSTWRMLFEFAPLQMRLEACQLIFEHIYQSKPLSDQLEALLCAVTQLEQPSWLRRSHWSAVLSWISEQISLILAQTDLTKVTAWSQLRNLIKLCVLAHTDKRLESTEPPNLGYLPTQTLQMWNIFSSESGSFVTQPDEGLIRAFLGLYGPTNSEEQTKQ